MKIRCDFVTNSSSSSYIICFARIKNMEKAKAIIEKYNIYTYSKEEVLKEINCYGELGCDSYNATIFDADELVEKYPNDYYIIMEDYNQCEYDEYCDPIENYDFGINPIIDQIIEKNGFTDIQIEQGTGYNG